jgi:hypothetical protein
VTNQYDEFLPEDENPSDAASSEEAKPEVPLPPLMRASDLLPPEVDASDDEIPPTPQEAELQSLPLRLREQRKLAAMTPEQRERYDAAQAEIMANPAVAAFAEEEERRKVAKAAVSEAFVAAYRKKMKERP